MNKKNISRSVFICCHSELFLALSVMAVNDPCLFLQLISFGGKLLSLKPT